MELIASPCSWSWVKVLTSITWCPVCCRDMFHKDLSTATESAAILSTAREMMYFTKTKRSYFRFAPPTTPESRGHDRFKQLPTPWPEGLDLSLWLPKASGSNKPTLIFQVTFQTFKYYNRRKASHQNKIDYISGASKICRPKQSNASTTSLQQLYTKTQRIYHRLRSPALKHDQKVQIFGDKRLTFGRYAWPSVHWRPHKKDLKELIREHYKDEREGKHHCHLRNKASEQSTRRLPTTSIKSHCGLCQPEGRRAGKSRDT